MRSACSYTGNSALQGWVPSEFVDLGLVYKSSDYRWTVKKAFSLAVVSFTYYVSWGHDGWLEIGSTDNRLMESGGGGNNPLQVFTFDLSYGKVIRFHTGSSSTNHHILYQFL